jgi:Tol biopolymer transport system component
LTFSSEADKLVPGVTGEQHIFVRDLVSNETTVVDRASGVSGEIANGGSGVSSVSANGRVAFATSATNLDPADTNGRADVYVRDLATHTTTLVSRGPSGVAASGASLEAVISADGSSVSFHSSAVDLTEIPAARRGGIYVRDLEAGTTTLATRAPGPGGSMVRADVYGRSISADGGRVLFSTGKSGFHPADRDGGKFDIFVRDLDSQQTILASRAVKTSGQSRFEEEALEGNLSGDGRSVAFRVGYCCRRNMATRVAVRHLGRRKTEVLGRARNSNSASPRMLPALTGDGRWLAFQTFDPLSTTEIDDVRDVFVMKVPR